MEMRIAEGLSGCFKRMHAPAGGGIHWRRKHILPCTARGRRVTEQVVCELFAPAV